jgi:tRNA(adenine34) deaminase
MSFDFSSIEHKQFMKEALHEAELAGLAGERPIGAVIVHNNQVIGRGQAQHIARKSNVAHAEMIALIQAEQYLFDHARDGCIIYTTVEPCVMCLGAIVMSNIRHIVYGISDKWILPGGMMNIDYVRRHVHNYLGGILLEDSISLFTRFRPQELPIMLEGKLEK